MKGSNLYIVFFTKMFILFNEKNNYSFEIKEVNKSFPFVVIVKIVLNNKN